MQGEYDALDSIPANHYKTNLTNFIAAVRDSLQLPNLPFIVGKIDDSGNWVWNAQVRKAEDEVAASVPHVGIFDTHDIPSDGAHYSTQGQLILGKRFAEAVKQFTKK